jgi:hypothetical protein
MPHEGDGALSGQVIEDHKKQQEQRKYRNAAGEQRRDAFSSSGLQRHLAVNALMADGVLIP